MHEIINQKKFYIILLIASWIWFITILFMAGRNFVAKNVSGVICDMNVASESNGSPRKPPPIIGSDSLFGDKTDFSYSPDKKNIAFVENVFEEFGKDYDKYWAVKLLDVKTRKEKTLLIDDEHMHDYEWRGTTTLRVIQSMGTGAHGYRDVDISLKKPDLYKDVAEGDVTFWQMDDAYAEQVRSYQLAREEYYGR